MGRPEDDLAMYLAEIDRQERWDAAMREWAYENWADVMADAMADGMSALSDTAQHQLFAAVLEDDSEASAFVMADLRAKFWAKAEEMFKEKHR